MSTGIYNRFSLRLCNLFSHSFIFEGAFTINYIFYEETLKLKAFRLKKRKLGNKESMGKFLYCKGNKFILP